MTKIWSNNKRTVAQVLWISFLTAAVGFVIIFGLIDPEALDKAFSLPFTLSRELGYGLGFLFLFFLSLIASCLTAWMIHTRHSPSDG